MMTRIGIFLMWLLHFLPLPLLAWAGKALGMVLYWLASERRLVAATNLRLCFPGLSEHERRVLAKKNFQAFARSFLERGMLWWSPPQRIQRLVRVAGYEHLQAASGDTLLAQPAVCGSGCEAAFPAPDASQHRVKAAAGQPVILLVPHFVALDVGWSWLTQQGNLVSVYSNQKNPYFHKKLLRGRLRFGASQLYSRQRGLRPIVKAMRAGLPFYYLPDQDLATKDGVFVPFFSIQAATLTTVPRLAEMTGAKVVPMTTCMLPDGSGYEVRFYPAWEGYPTGDLSTDTRRMNEFIEQRVREMPEQYFWLHKRFKTRPKGEKKLY